MECGQVLTSEQSASTHFSVCSEKIVSCKECKLSIKNQLLKGHLKHDCQEIEEFCKCRKQMKRKEIASHDCVKYLVETNRKLQMENIDLKRSGENKRKTKQA